MVKYYLVMKLTHLRIFFGRGGRRDPSSVTGLRRAGALPHSPSGGRNAVACVGLTLLLLPIWAAADVASVAVPEPTVVERGPHVRKWQTVSAVRAGDKTIFRTNSYSEIGSGICYLKDGQWLDSQEAISIVNGFGIADQGMHRAVFSPSVTDSPMLDYEDPDGNRLQFRPLCLAYLDYASGKAARI